VSLAGAFLSIKLKHARSTRGGGATARYALEPAAAFDTAPVRDAALNRKYRMSSPLLQ
jgi:hypothetical protein